MAEVKEWRQMKGILPKVFPLKPLNQLMLPDGQTPSCRELNCIVSALSDNATDKLIAFRLRKER